MTQVIKAVIDLGEGIYKSLINFYPVTRTYKIGLTTLPLGNTKLFAYKVEDLQMICKPNFFWVQEVTLLLCEANIEYIRNSIPYPKIFSSIQICPNLDDVIASLEFIFKKFEELTEIMDRLNPEDRMNTDFSLTEKHDVCYCSSITPIDIIRTLKRF